MKCYLLMISMSVCSIISRHTGFEEEKMKLNKTQKTFMTSVFEIPSVTKISGIYSEIDMQYDMFHEKTVRQMVRQESQNFQKYLKNRKHDNTTLFVS